MAIRGKLIFEIAPENILGLLVERAPEDDFLEFKEHLFSGPQEYWKQEDLVADLVAFANARGGHILFGIQEQEHRASGLAPMEGDLASRNAERLQHLAAVHIHPGLHQLDIRPFAIDQERKEWLVIAHIPDSSTKPYMSFFDQRSRFTIRLADQKRDMTYEEIQAAFLGSHEQQLLREVQREVISLRQEVASLKIAFQALDARMKGGS